MDVRIVLTKFLLEYFDTTESQINEELGNMDSLDQADLAYRIEDLFNCNLPRDAKLNSFDDLVQLVEKTSVQS